MARQSALLIDVLRTLDEPTPVLPGRSVRDDLVLLVEFARRCGLAKRDSAVLRNVVLQFQNAPELWQRYRDTVILVRRTQVLEVMQRVIDDALRIKVS